MKTAVFLLLAISAAFLGFQQKEGTKAETSRPVTKLLVIEVIL